MIGTIVEDRYLIEEELGEGAMGKVYRARHIKVGRKVALKVMHRDLAKVPSIVERFAREAMIAARLRHPNLVSVLDVGTLDRLPMIVLELAPGHCMRELTCVPQPAARVIDLLAQLLRGLDHAHSAGLVHRDLKPDNILVEVTADGTMIPRIVDFGIAVTRERDDSVAGQRLTDVNTVIGTPLYMSPEQARAHELDHRTDLFSLGVIAYELLAGVAPHVGEAVDVVLANVSREAPPIKERAGIDVDPLLEAFARKLMARRLDQRFQSAREALDVLELIERDRFAAARMLGVELLPPAAALVNFEEIAAPRPRHRPVRAIGAAVAALAIVVVAGVSLRGRTAAASEIGTDQIAVTGEPLAIESATVATEERAPIGAPEPVLSRPAPAVVSHRVTIASASAVKTPTIARDTLLEIPSADLAARYVAVGKALRGGPDELRARYRLIRINDALASDEGRRAALATLAQIERALR